MATLKKFEEILAWQEARTLAKMVYDITRKGALAKDFGLRDQIQRAAVSVGSNIAEGFERSGSREFQNFLWIAKGSAGEVASQLYVLLDAGFLSQEDFDLIYHQAHKCSYLLYRLILSIKTSSVSGVKNK